METKTAPFGAVPLPAEEEHDQGCNSVQYLLIAQLNLQCQLDHGLRPNVAGRPANWLRVGICIAPRLALALGLSRMALGVGYG